jgi:viroplasmin and RNaseH domain-containing protein
MTTHNFYAVVIGRKPGIYTSWADCHKQVTKFHNHFYKGFDTFEEAWAFYPAEQGSKESDAEEQDVDLKDARIPKGGTISIDASVQTDAKEDEGIDRETQTETDDIDVVTYDVSMNDLYHVNVGLL